MRKTGYIILLISILINSCRETPFQDITLNEKVYRCKNINDSVRICYTDIAKGGVSFLRIDNKTITGKKIDFWSKEKMTNIVSYKDGKMHGKAFLYINTSPFLIGYIEYGKTKFKIERAGEVKFEYYTQCADSGKVKTVDTTFVDSDSIKIISYTARFSADSDVGAGDLIYINNKISEYSDYIQLKVPDTVQMGETFTAEFNNHIWDSDKAWLIFGEYNENLEIVEPKHPDTITIYDGKPYYHKLKATQPGVNKITGIVVGITDSTRRNPKPFYDMYYVKE